MKIEEEIQQSKFASEFQKAHVNILFTAAWLNQETSRVLKPYGISVQQFNILRILRGMNPKPATIKTLTERMIDKMSNASRLVDKLEQKGLVTRTECDKDRRRVDVSITQKGLELIDNASDSMEKQMHVKAGTLTTEMAVQLNDLLDQIRD
jgi:DNA-binding MarR family transcriptional regulator